MNRESMLPLVLCWITSGLLGCTTVYPSPHVETRGEIAKAHDHWVQIAQNHEANSNISAAIDAWWVAHALSQSRKSIEKHIRQLEVTSRRLAHPFLVEALSAYVEDRPKSAVKAALEALQRDPDNVEAITLLRKIGRDQSAARMSVAP